MLRRDDELAVYFRQGCGDNSLTSYYADVCIAHVGRLRERGWKFAESEQWCGRQALAGACPMGIMANPFLMYLPEVPVYRGRRMTLAERLLTVVRGSEPNSFVQLDPEALRDRLAREPAALPFAEDCLTTSRPVHRTPWVYTMMDSAGMLRRIHALEIRVLRLWQRVLKRFA